MRLNAKQIADYAGGTFAVRPIDASAHHERPDVGLARRAAGDGCTWPCRASRVDGHDFVDGGPARRRLGGRWSPRPLDEATRTLLPREMGAAVIEVPDTAAALTDLARAWRGHLRGTVDRRHGVHRQDHHQEPRARRAGGARLRGGHGRATRTTSWACPRRCFPPTPTRASMVVEMGMRGLGPARAACATSYGPDWGPGHQRGRKPYRAPGQPRQHRARPRPKLSCAPCPRRRAWRF